MNKNEIAQQFTKQMLEQKQTGLTPEQVLTMIREIEQLHKKSQKGTEDYSQFLTRLSYFIQDMQKAIQQLNGQVDQLNAKMLGVTNQYQKKEKASIWHRYWAAILMGIIATLITNLIWILKA